MNIGGGGGGEKLKNSIDFQPVKVAFFYKTYKMQAIRLQDLNTIIINVYIRGTLFNTLETCLLYTSPSPRD